MHQLTKDSIKIFQLEKNHLKRIIQLMKKYSDLPMDLADASLVVLAEEISEDRILTTDFRDFTIYRWQENKTFNFLLN